MLKKVFVGHCHQQGKWVWDRLVPVLKAGGAEVLTDRERFAAGRAILGKWMLRRPSFTTEAENQLVLLQNLRFHRAPRDLSAKSRRSRRGGEISA